MYDDLVKRLRSTYEADYFDHGVLLEAADAIEKLQEQLGWKEHFDILTELDCNLPKWIPVTDRLPEKHERVLVYSKATRMGRSIDFINSDGNWYTTSQVTHWMPLPEPPKEE